MILALNRKRKLESINDIEVKKATIKETGESSGTSGEDSATTIVGGAVGPEPLLPP